MKSSNSSAMLILWSIGAIVAAIIAIGVFPPLFGGLVLFFWGILPVDIIAVWALL